VTSLQRVGGRLYLCDHFTTLAGSDLGEELQDQDLRDVPGEVPHVPAGRGVITGTVRR